MTFSHTQDSFLEKEGFLDPTQEARRELEEFQKSFLDPTLEAGEKGRRNVEKEKKDIWGNPDFFRKNLAPRRWEHQGMQFYTDCETTFYKVQKGDTMWGLREKISRVPGFEYLKNLAVQGNQKVKGFNISPSQLKAGNIIPLPIHPQKRAFTSQELVGHFDKGLNEIRNHKKYGKVYEKLLSHLSQKEIINCFLALSEQESHKGRSAYFRPETGKKGRIGFSYSLFHVMEGGPGKRALDALNMTIGQSYHPQNGVQLAFAFICEKMQDFRNVKRISQDIRDYFPLDDLKTAESLADIYNGLYWRRYNPNYAKNIKNYYQEESLNSPKEIIASEKPVPEKEENLTEKTASEDPSKPSWENQRFDVSLYVPTPKGVDVTTMVQRASDKAREKYGYSLLRGVIGNRTKFAEKIEKKLGGLKAGDYVRLEKDPGNNPRRGGTIFFEIRRRGEKNPIYISFYADELLGALPLAEKNNQQEHLEVFSPYIQIYTAQGDESVSLLAARLSYNYEDRFKIEKIIENLNPDLQEKIDPQTKKLKKGAEIKVLAQKIVADRNLDEIVSKYYGGWENHYSAKRTLRALNGKDPDEVRTISGGDTLLVPIFISDYESILKNEK